MKGHFLALLMTLAFYSSSLHGSIVSTPSSAEQKRIEEFRSKLLKSLERGNTPDQSPDQSPASTHELFKTHQAALDWAISVSERLAKGSSAKIFNVLPLTDSRYPELQKMVGEIWLGYTDLFPEFTQGLNEPPVILVESEVMNAFVPQAIIHENRIAHAVVIFTPLVDLAGGPGNRDLMSGVIGHELAHSVFRHLLPDYKKGIRKFYDPKSSRFGFESKRNSGG